MIGTNKAIALVIPAFNEGERLTHFLVRLLKQLDRFATDFRSLSSDSAFLGDATSIHCVIVDDGSKQPVILAPALTPCSSAIHLHTLRHELNLGQGAALQTGITYARQVINADFFVTIDADGQHDPGALLDFFQAMAERKLDIVFGNRFAGKGATQIPPVRKFILRVAALFEKWLSGLALTDVHNGLRVFNRKCADVIDLQQQRMAHATEFKQIVARHRLAYGEVPTKITYTSATLRKGQSNLNSFAILKDLFKLFLFGGV